jgi:hypothetical protein
MAPRTRLFLVLAAVWMVAMTWRLYPQFGNAIRVDGRLTTVARYIDDSCGQRVGPAAATCLAESGEKAQLLLRREQARSVLLILAPLLVYGIIWRPLQFLRARIGARSPAATVD